MRVTFVADKLNLEQGGSNHSLHLTASSLAERGHDVEVVTFNVIHQNSVPENPTYRVVPDPVDGNKLAKASQVYRRLDDYDGRADVLHVFNPALLPITGYYRKRRGETPMVGRLNTYDVFCTNVSRMTANCFERCTVGAKFRHDDASMGDRLASLPKYAFDTFAFPGLCEEMDRLFALSPSVAEIYGAIGIDAGRIDVVPNFYDPDFPDSGSGEDPFDSEGFRVLFVGRVGEQKGVDLLVDAIGRSNNSEEYAVEIVGDGPLKEALEAEVRKSGLDDVVTFHGWVDHDSLADYYRGADAFVHPGRWPEPFGRTMLESMQCECPPIVSDIGAPPWIVGDCGLTFEPDDAAGLSRTIATARATRSSIGQADYRERLSEFSPETVVTGIEERYQSLRS